MIAARRHAATVVSLLAVGLIYYLASRSDGGETAGGQLTGPMILACFAAVPILLASIGAGLRHRRCGLVLWIGGTLLAAPLATYGLFPGWWGTIGPWSDPGEMPWFSPRWDCIVLLSCLLLSLGVQARAEIA